ncbi:MAG: cytosolic protein, partial [bacterium]|nr:cytosolic protein [bacterium]
MSNTQQTQRDDYDSPWKDMLSEYFQEFIRFFFPDVGRDIDWKRGYELLDKEFRQITREAESGTRVTDQLVKVWTIEGEETWVLIHVEVQAQRQSSFPQRMYVYNYRIYDLYQRPVASFGVLADEHAAWKPSGFYQKIWRTRTLFRFPVVKILDYTEQWEMLEQSTNPFAIVVQAHLKTLETRQDGLSRSRWKVTLT